MCIKAEFHEKRERVIIRSVPKTNRNENLQWTLLISILNIINSLRTYWHRVTNITSFEKYLESSSGHTLTFYPNLVKYRFNNMFLKEYLARFFYGDLVYQLRRVKCEANFISSDSNIVRRLRRRQYSWTSNHQENYKSCVWPFYSIVQIN